MEACSDADWAEDLTDSKSFGGYCVIFAGGGVVHSGSKKQRCVATSSAHAEYVVLFECMTERKWFQSLFKELKQERYLRKAVTVYCDNQSAIGIAQNFTVCDRTKHFCIKLHYCRERVAKRDCEVKYVSTSENLADIFNKADKWAENY